MAVQVDEWRRSDDAQVQGNARLTEASDEATRRLNVYTAAGRAAAEVGACAESDAAPSRRGLVSVGDSNDWLCALFAIGLRVGGCTSNLNWRQPIVGGGGFLSWH